MTNFFRNGQIKQKKYINYIILLKYAFCQVLIKSLEKLRDEKDIPVLSDAMALNMDIILTGDKDFLESDITSPLIYSPKMMYEYLHR